MGCLCSKERTRESQQQQFREQPWRRQPTVSDVTEALELAGIRSLKLIVGIDFTNSNEWNGKISFHGLNLHHTDDFQNPYEHAISIIGEALSRFTHNRIPCYGFGDESTKAVDVFSFYEDDRPCDDFTDLTNRYRQLSPHVNLSGPTSFAPIIEMAMTIVENSGCQYHVLIIVADGQVPRSIETSEDLLSPEEQTTFNALVKASEFPLSILLVGVGDGPWERMNKFCEPFPNFQFVNFTEIMSGNSSQSMKEATFASSALAGIPSQCVMITGSEILGRRTGSSPNKVALPPPHSISYPPQPIFSEPTAPPHASAVESGFNAEYVCPICFLNPKNMTFGCGHRTCVDCSPHLDDCPICRQPIQTRIRLYD